MRIQANGTLRFTTAKTIRCYIVSGNFAVSADMRAAPPSTF